MPIHKLTPSQLPRLAKQPGLHSDGGKLYLQVRGGSAVWIFRYRMQGGRDRYMGLGALHTTTIDEARAKAAKLRAAVAEGRDPLGERAIVRAVPTFRALLDEFMIAKGKPAPWRDQLRVHALDLLGDLRVDTIDMQQVVTVLRPLWGRVNGQKLRSKIAQVLDYAKVYGFRTGDNPAAWQGALEHILAKPADVAPPIVRMAALPYAELPAFMGELARHDRIEARAMEFMILTACRRGDVLGQIGKAEAKPALKWEHVDVGKKIWIIPAVKTAVAGDEPFQVPLSDEAVAVLQQVRQRGVFGPFVFSSPKGRAHGSLNYKVFDRFRMRVLPDHDMHGFRATFKTWATEETTTENHVQEQCLAHKVLGERTVEGAYRRSMWRKRVALMAAWGAYASGGDPGKFVTMHTRAA